jgi:unconventional prefoldin RPB5 interactor 1
MDMSGLDELEDLRQKLETNITKLRKALSYWQTWEAEHEGLNEELQELGEDASAEDMYDVGTGIGGDVVTEQGMLENFTVKWAVMLTLLDMRELVGLGKSPRRTRDQVISSIKGRMETGRRNAQTVQKQLNAAEEKLSDMAMASYEKDDDGKGPPMMEIYEELDEDGNVICE